MCIHPYIPPCIPAHGWSVTQASFALVPVTTRTHFQILQHILMTLTKWTPRCLYKTMTQITSRRWQAFHGGLWLDSHYANYSRTSWCSVLFSRNCRIQYCILTKSVPPVTDKLESIHATIVTVSMVRSMSTCSNGGPW